MDLKAGVPVGRYLADQLLIPMALANGGRFRTMPLTCHTETNIEMVQRFLDVHISAEEVEKKIWEVAIRKAG